MAYSTGKYRPRGTKTRALNVRVEERTAREMELRAIESGQSVGTFHAKFLELSFPGLDEKQIKAQIKDLSKRLAATPAVAKVVGNQTAPAKRRAFL